MKFDRAYSLEEIAGIIGAQDFFGPSGPIISGLNILPFTAKGEIAFVDKSSYLKHAAESSATAILVSKNMAVAGKALIVSEDPFAGFARLIEHFGRQQKDGPAAERIGKDTIVHPGAQIGQRVRIGKNCIIHPNAVLYNGVRLGDNVVIHSNAVIGADAFYFKKKDSAYHKMPSGGGCVIENDAEIGAGCTIDRGVTRDTTIGRGSKIDNQVHIGHDTILGANCLIAGCVGIAGCVTIEDDVVIRGQAGVTSGITIGRGAEILAQSAVLNSLKGGRRYFGTPAQEARTKMKELVVLKELASNGRSLR